MRLNCRLREIRGKDSLRDYSTATGINRGQLSLIELGRLLPKDEWLPALERVYGQPRTAFYDASGLLAIQADPEEEP